MNQLRNRVQLIGHLGKDPEVRQFEGGVPPSGNMKAQFSLATSETYKNNKGEKVTDTQWHQVVCWGKLAQIAAEYLQKGQQVAVEGKLTYRSYEDKQGMKRYITEVIASDILMLDKKETATAEKAVVEDSLPF